MKVITFANQKGGVAKSTSSTAVAGILQEKGYKVLLVDTDSTASSTDSYGIVKTDGVTTLYDVILDTEPVPIKEAIHHTECGDIVPSDDLLDRAEIVLANNPDGMFKLADALESLDGYDFVIVDTGPRLDVLLLNALVACDELVIPVTADRFGLKGLVKLNESVASVKKRHNRNLHVAGILITKYHANTKLAKSAQESLRQVAELFHTKLFDTPIRECVKQMEAQSKFQTINQYAPNSTTAKDYKTFTDELLNSILH